MISLIALALAGSVSPNVRGEPSITLSPTSGYPGTRITFAGSGFSPTDTVCTVGTPNPAVLPGSDACVVQVGTGKLSGGFIIASVAMGAYVISVGGNQGDFAQAVLTVNTTGLGLMITLIPNSGLPGDTIKFTGSGFNPADSICAVAGTPVLSGSQACVIQAGTGTVSGGFIIGPVAAGAYVISVGGAPVAGQPGDQAQAVLTILGELRSLILHPSFGPSGLEVLFNGTLSGNPNTCTVTSTATGVVLNGACVIGATINSSGTACSATTVTVTATTITTTITTVGVGRIPFCGSFEVGAVPPGEYVIRVTGNDNSNNFVEAIFDVTSGPTIQLTCVGLTPTYCVGTTAAEAGATISVIGTGFFSDTGCAIGAPGSAAILGGTQACVIRNPGSGVVTASFTVGPVSPGEYVIQVTGSPAGDLAQAILNVTSRQEDYGPSVNQIFTSSTALGFEETGNIFDNSGAGYMIAHRSSSRAVFVFTDSTRVNQTTGELLFSPDYSNAVVVAGPAANPTTAFYESHGFTPLTASVSGGNAVFKQGAATVYTVSLASLSSTNDYFLMEAFQDVGHTVIILYGVNAPGTLASGVYFDAFVYPNLANYPSSAYIVHWQGATPNTPLPSDTYTIVFHT